MIPFSVSVKVLVRISPPKRYTFAQSSSFNREVILSLLDTSQISVRSWFAETL